MSAHFSNIISCLFSIASNNSATWTSCQLLMYSKLSTVQKLSHNFFLLCSFRSPTHTYMPVLILFMTNSLAYFYNLFYMLHYLRGLCLLFLELLVCSLLLHSVCFLLTSPPPPHTQMFTHLLHDVLSTSCK